MTDHCLATDELRRQIAAQGGLADDFFIEQRAACSSTNSELLALAEHGAASATVLITGQQTAGRGRRGRQWISAPGDSLTFSLLWRFQPGTLPTGLSLAVGVAIMRALRKLSPGETGRPSGRRCPEEGTAPALALKWPNDLLLDGRKLAGTLVELVPGAPHAAVIGIGLNRRLPAALPEELRAHTAAWGEATTSEALLAALLVELRQVFAVFAEQGFAALRAAWQSGHAHQDAAIVLLSDFAAEQTGICRGVDSDGALLLETTEGIQRILSGDVSLRARPVR